jgi:glutaredoxin 3
MARRHPRAPSGAPVVIPGKAAAMQPVVIYSSDWCGYCARAKLLLERKGAPFDEKVVDGDPALRREMERLSGRYTVPQIFIGGRHVGGCDDLYELESRHELDALLGVP